MLQTAVKALRQILANLDQRATNGTLETFRTSRAVAFDNDALQPQKARPVVARRRQIGTQPAQQWQIPRDR